MLDETGMAMGPLHTIVQPSLCHITRSCPQLSPSALCLPPTTRKDHLSQLTPTQYGTEASCADFLFRRCFSTGILIYLDERSIIKAFLFTIWFIISPQFQFLLIFFFFFPLQKIFQSSWLRAVTSKRNQEKVKPSRLPKTLNRSKKSQGEKIHKLCTLHHL